MGNFILGIIIGIILFLLLAYVIYKLDDNNIREQIGEDFEYRIMTKSEIEHIRELLKKEEKRKKK